VTEKLNVVEKIDELRGLLYTARAGGKRIGLVPTMGYLHAGHLSLVENCKEHADYIVVSIFVNPTQFGPNEDLESYPRDFERDRKLLAAQNVDVIFSPSPDEIYPGEQLIQFNIDKLTQYLCGASRPGHFEGVLLVVAKLFNLVQPDVAVFGQKDLQQLIIIKRMVDELNFPIHIIAGPTMREPDGLAMSSRNAYLTDAERAKSVALYNSMSEAQRAIEAGERSAKRLLDQIRTHLETHSGGRIDYAEIVRLEDLQPIDPLSGRIAIVLAVFVGKARLIDNLVLELEGAHVREIPALDA